MTAHERDSHRWARALAEANAALTSTLELEPLLENLLAVAARAIPAAEKGCVFLCNDASDAVEARALFGCATPDEYSAVLRPIEPVARQVARDAQPLFVPHSVRRSPDPAETCEGRSVALAPLCYRERVIGVLALDNGSHPKAFDADDLALLTALADQAAVVVENARLYEEGEAERLRLATLYEVSRQLGSAPTLEQVAHAALQAASYVGAEHGDLMLFEVQGSPSLFSTVPERSDLPATQARGFIALITASGLEAWVLEHRRSALVIDTLEDPRWLVLPGHEQFAPLRSAVCAPLIDRSGQVMGILLYAHSRPAAFGTEEQKLVEEIALRAAVALENARLYEETQRRVRELTLLNWISSQLTALDVDSLVNAALQGLREILEADRAYFVTGDPATRTNKITHESVAPGVTQLLGLRIELDRAPQIIDEIGQRRVVAVADTAIDPRTAGLYQVMHGPYGARSTLVVPVQAEGLLQGGLAIHHVHEQHTWRPDEICLVEGVARQLELALANVRLLREARVRNDELTRALARLQELDHLKSEFIQNVSHELRSPLALIRGYAGLLDAGELGELDNDQKDAVSVITRRSEMLSELVDDIVLILLAESRHLERQMVELDAVIRAAVADFGLVADQSGVTLELDVASNLPPVWGTPLYLRRVADNLLSNAIKFTPERGHVSVSVRRQDEWVVLEVSDTGIGIPEQKAGRLFERFYQVDGSTRRRHGGVGLGLALVKEIVEGYGGRVAAKSEEGKGSTFTVWLVPVGDVQEAL